jgi:8-oxo-dGTP pyrophosphatase MutT (NUDIX family)
MNKFIETAESLFKAGDGEGSKGGHVIGHTKSGKPIYASSSHPEHAKFSPQEHTEAMNHHYEIWSKTQAKIGKIKEKRPNWNPPKEITSFLQHHHTQMQMHQNRASRGMARQAAPKNFGVQHGTAPAKHPYHTPQNIHKGLNDIEVPFLAAVVVISPDKKKVLLGKRSKDEEWESPAGHADIGEHPEDVVIRECFEEFSVPLRIDQLEQLPMMYKKDMTPIHCYMAITEPDQIKNVSCEDDPSEEHTKWKWFALDEKLPEPMEDNRFNTIIHAKMKLAGIIVKSYMQLDDTEGMSQMHTTEFATEREHDRAQQDFIESKMRDYKPGDAPVVMGIGDVTNLHLVKIDDGLYSGFVKKVDSDGLEETVANIDKMTIPSMVQFLRAKQLLWPVTETPVDHEKQLKIILDVLSSKQTGPVTMKYVSMDGDNIGNRVAQAEAENDEQRLMEMSHKIEAGQSVFRTWIQTVGGAVIESGGDEGVAKVPEAALDKVEAFRNQYMSVSGATVTVGIGSTISECTRARELGKLKGKNRVEFFTAESDAQLKDMLKPVNEAQKIIESGVLKLLKALEHFEKAMDLEKYVEDADQEVAKKTEKEIELDTAKKWAARAIAAIKLGNKAKAMHYADEALEHASMVKDMGKTVGAIQQILLDRGVPFDDDVEKSLIRILRSNDEFQKGQTQPIGTVRVWADQHFRKEASGHWMPIAGANGATGPAEAAGGPGGAAPDATAAPSKAPNIEDEPKPTKEVKPEAKHLKHLLPKEGMGGHVTAHSRDLKNALDRGPFSLISSGRNHKNADDRGMTDEQVSHRSKKLEQDLKDSGHKYMKVKGKYNGGSHDSFLTFHAKPEHMDELAKKYNQESVIHSEDGKHRQHFVNGDKAGKHYKGEGHVMVPDAEDNFTEANTSDGKKMKFTLGMDQGKLHEKA